MQGCSHFDRLFWIAAVALTSNGLSVDDRRLTSGARTSLVWIAFAAALTDDVVESPCPSTAHRQIASPHSARSSEEGAFKYCTNILIQSEACSSSLKAMSSVHSKIIPASGTSSAGGASDIRADSFATPPYVRTSVYVTSDLIISNSLYRPSQYQPLQLGGVHWQKTEPNLS